MPRSTPASDTAELAAIAAPIRAIPPGPARGLLRAMASSPAGRVGFVLVGTTLAVALLAPLIATTDPFALTGPPLRPPSADHLMGTDALGRDAFSGVVFGARTSVAVATSVVLLTLALGLGVGMMAGYGSALIDDVLMRVTELFHVMPRFLLVVVGIALFGSGLPQLILILGLTSWPTLARVVRAEVLSLREQDFVRAAEASGATPGRILARELLPNLLPSAIVMAGLLFGQVLLVEASLGFLGIGDPNAISWGLLAGQAQGFLRVAWWLPFFPGLAITIAVLGWNLLADALTRALGGR